MLNETNAQELAQIAKDVGALVLHGQLRYPGPETGDWDVSSDVAAQVSVRCDDEAAALRA
jgi:hypothetical protein